MENHHKYQVGDTVTYEGAPAEVVGFDGPLIVEIYGPFGKSFYVSVKAHSNKILAALGFTTSYVAEFTYSKQISVSHYNLNKQ